MRIRVLRELAVAVVLGAMVCGAKANGFRNPPDGAASLGRTGGKIADVDDVSAISVNPANLAALTQPSVQAGGTLASSDIEFAGADGRTSEDDGGVNLLPSVFGATPLPTAHPMVLGVGLTTPWGQATEWSPDSAVAQSAPYIAKLTTVNVNPTLATRLGEKVLVGVGVDFMQAELDLRQYALLGAGVPPTHIRLQGDGTGISGNAGLTAELPKGQRAAFTYRCPMDVDLDGDMDVSGFTGPLAPVSDFGSEMAFPAIAAVGYSLPVSEDVRVAVDVEWVEFSRFDTLPLDLGANGAAGLFPPSIPQDWNDTWNYGIGAAWAVDGPWTLRGGIVYLETPIPEETLAPTLPDDDRLVYSAGVGYAQGPASIDLAYAFSAYDRDVNTSQNPAFLGSYEATIHLMQVSYAHTF